MSFWLGLGIGIVIGIVGIGALIGGFLWLMGEKDSWGVE